MRKIIISKLFLYRHRFVIGYVVLTIAFVALLFVLPFIAQTGLSEAEINSATSSYYLGKDGVFNGDVVDLPYRILQKYSVTFFGLSAFTVKLPSIIMGLILGFLLILLLNRWFKNNVSLLASCLIVLSTPFLFIAGSGTPLIMIVFWPTLLLWLGSKIQGEKRPKPLYSLMFAIAMLASIFTPYMIYFAVFCVLFVLCQPHLRFIVRNLPKLPLAIVAVIVLGGFIALGISIFHHPSTIMELLFTRDFQIGDFFHNVTQGLAPAFAWHTSKEGVFLSPLISLPIFALAFVGLFSTTKGFFASRNSIASILIIFGLLITGFNPNAVVFLILPFSILIAHGLKYLLIKWYGLFPENPYARISALIPLTILFALIIIPALLQYVNGYRYNPAVANEFDHKLSIIKQHLTDEKLLVTEHFDFYKILENYSDIRIISEVGPNEKLAILGAPAEAPENYALTRIITSPMRDNSDIIYLYTYSEEKGE